MADRKVKKKPYSIYFKVTEHRGFPRPFRVKKAAVKFFLFAFQK